MLISSHLLSEVEQTVDDVVVITRFRAARPAGPAGRSSPRTPKASARVLVRTPGGRRGSPTCCAPAGSSVTAGGRRRAAPSPARTPADVGRRAFAAGIELHELRAADQRPRGDLLPAHRRPGAVRRSAARRDRRRGGRPMIRLVRAEWTKLFTTRVWLGLLLGACVMVAGFAALLTGFAGRRRRQPGSRRSVTPLFEQLAFATAADANVLFLILGIIGMTQEYRHRTATPDVPDRPAARPRRGRQARRLRAGRRAVRAAGPGRERAGRDRLRRRPGRGAVPHRRQPRGPGHLRAGRWSSTR